MVAREKTDVQYIELDGNTSKNFGLLIMCVLNRRGFIIGTRNSIETKLIGQG